MSRALDVVTLTGAEYDELMYAAEDLRSANTKIERLRALLADIKDWDVDQYMILPHDLRVRMQREIGDGK